MKTIIVSPKEGLTVRHPETGAPIVKDTELIYSPQIKRYLKDGDLVEIPRATVEVKAKAKKETK